MEMLFWPGMTPNCLAAPKNDYYFAFTKNNPLIPFSYKEKHSRS